MTAVNLVVIRSNDLSTAVAFYERLGLEFRREQHGNGPEHFAAELGDLVFEIYPSQQPSSVETVRLGFAVDRLSTVIEAVRNFGAKVISEPQSSPWGMRAVVEDPDGRKMELTERLAD